MTFNITREFHRNRYYKVGTARLLPFLTGFLIILGFFVLNVAFTLTAASMKTIGVRSSAVTAAFHHLSWKIALVGCSYGQILLIFNNLILESIQGALVDMRAPVLLKTQVDEGRINNASLTRKIVTRGNLQGGNLSSLLCLLVINGNLRSCAKQRVKDVTYAVDVTVMVGGYFPSTITDLVQTALRMASEWAKSLP